MGNARSTSAKTAETAEPAERDQNNCAVSSERADDLFSEQFDVFQQKSGATLCRPENGVQTPSDRPVKAFTEPVRRMKPFRGLGGAGAKSVSFKTHCGDKKCQSAGERASAADSPDEREERASRAADEERCAHLAAESRDKIENINNLIEALANFNKIFRQFPKDYDKLVRRILSLSYARSSRPASAATAAISTAATGQLGKTGLALAKMSGDNLAAIQSLIGHLCDHAKAVQNMVVLMSRLEERIDTTNQVLRSNARAEPVEPFSSQGLLKATRRASRIRKSAHR